MRFMIILSVILLGSCSKNEVSLRYKVRPYPFTIALEYKDPSGTIQKDTVFEYVWNKEYIFEEGDHYYLKVDNLSDSTNARIEMFVYLEEEIIDSITVYGPWVSGELSGDAE